MRSSTFLVSVYIVHTTRWKPQSRSINTMMCEHFSSNELLFVVAVARIATHTVKYPIETCVCVCGVSRFQLLRFNTRSCRAAISSVYILYPYLMRTGLGWCVLHWLPFRPRAGFDTSSNKFLQHFSALCSGQQLLPQNAMCVWFVRVQYISIILQFSTPFNKPQQWYECNTDRAYWEYVVNTIAKIGKDPRTVSASLLKVVWNHSK